MSTLQEALVATGRVNKEQAEFEKKLQLIPDVLRPLVRRFNDLKDRWPQLRGEKKLLLALNIMGARTVQERKVAFELAISALEEIPE